MKKASVSLIVLSALLPAVTFAQSLGNLENLLRAIGRLVNLATPIIVGLALLAFFWGLVKYIFSAGEDDAKKEGVRLMVGGIIAIFVIVSIVGIVRFIGRSLDVDQGGKLPVPGVQN
ncbi:MAG TPA: hypothetical protein VJ837_03745 [Candidatus Paceibacterota bacterium]|nr:hypothetical protein [Candidatus Paceibacterota bacterium]